MADVIIDDATRRRRGYSRPTRSACLLALVLQACAHPAPPVLATPPVTAAPPAETRPPVTAPSHWTLPLQVGAATYSAHIVAALERDSSGKTQRESLETRGTIAWQMQRDSAGAIHATGRVDSFSVRGLERAFDSSSKGTAAKSPAAVVFDAVLDATSVRITTRPALVNECDQPEVAATALVRELLVRIPASLSIGDQWQDSTVAFVCRASIPINVRQHNHYRVERADERDGRTELTVRRTIDTQLDGAIRTAWRTVELSGSGQGNQSIRIDATSGSVQALEGKSTLTLKVSDSARRDEARMQSVVQTATLSFVKQSP